MSRAVRRTKLLIKPGYGKLVRWLCPQVAHTSPSAADFGLAQGFHYELRAVAAGRAVHKGGAPKPDDAKRFLLRRAIHRLEKGLISRPRRLVFAADYIEQTVELYCTEVALNSSDPDQTLQTWAGDVLEQYLSVVSADTAIDRARAAYEQYLTDHPRQAGQAAPYIRDCEPLKVDIDAMLALAKRRRSVRHYLPKPVPRELVDNALIVAGYAPSACNRQPFIFRIFDEPELVQKVSAIPMGTRGFHENFPCVAVIVGQLRAFPEPRDRHLIYIDGSLAAMSFVYALEVQGLSSCCINWPEISEREDQMIAALDLAPDERPVMLISFGYPDPEALVPFSQKRPLDELRTYNQ